MSRGPLVLVGVIALALGAAALSQWVSGRAVPEHPLELAPVGTTAVVRVDVPALLDSPLWAAWVGEGDEGYHRIVDRCGFDPLLDLRTVDVYLVGTSRRPLDQVGFVARGPLRHEELARCVELISEEDGGGVHEVEIEGGARRREQPRVEPRGVRGERGGLRRRREPGPGSVAARPR
jgi:hypothetical protein